VKLVDSHCHLDDERFTGDREEVIARASASGVAWLLTIGTGDGPPELDCAVRIAERHERVLATVGVHPHDAVKADESTIERLQALLGHPKVVGLGEIGLDYFHNFSPPERQRELFEAQLRLAAAAGKPVIIHTREAWDDTFALLDRHFDRRRGGVMHCFTGGVEEAERCLELGFHLSFAGMVTYPKATGIQAAAKVTPRDRLLVETDSPYLAPVPHRGKRNEPAFVVNTVRRLAELRGETVEEVAEAATRNFSVVFARPEVCDE